MSGALTKTTAELTEPSEESLEEMPQIDATRFRRRSGRGHRANHAFFVERTMDPSPNDKRRESVWRRLLQIDDELAALDKPSQTISKALDDVRNEALERLERQRVLAIRDAEKNAREKLASHLDQHAFRVDSEKFQQWRTDVHSIATDWSTKVIKIFDQDTRNTVQQILEQTITLPEPKQPKNRVEIDDDVPYENVHLPGNGELILRFWGAHKDTAILPATLIGFGYFAFATPWTDTLSKLLASVGTGLMFPILVWLGYSAAKNERRKLLLEAQKKHEAAIKSFVEQQLGETMKEHQATLARWIHARQTSWQHAALARHDEQFVKANDTSIQDKRRELLIEKKRLQEKDRQLQAAE